MQESIQNQSLDELFDRLVQVLVEERTALIRMDGEGLEKATAEKELLHDLILGQKGTLSQPQQTKLRGLRGHLQQNLILLAHARDFLHNALGIIDTGQHRGARPSQPRVLPAHLDLRG